MLNKFKINKDVFSYGIITLVFFIVIVRTFYGFDWSDETYYIALPYRFLLGDSMFIHSWDIHQLSALIILPFVWLYNVFVGGTDGIILFFRILYAVCQYSVALIIFKTLKKYYNKYAVLFTAIVLLIFAPSSISNLSYNTMSLQLFSVAITLFIEILHSKRERKFVGFFCGLTYALSVQAYPYLVITLPLVIIGMITKFKKEGYDDRKILKNKLKFIGIGILAVVISFTIFVLCNSSIKNIVNNVKYILSDPEHISRGPLEPLFSYYDSIVSGYGIIVVATIATVIITLITRFIRSDKSKNIINSMIYILGIIILIKGMIITLESYVPNIIMINYLCIPFALVGPIFYTLAYRKTKRVFYTFWIGGILYSIAIQYGTNNGLGVSSFGLLFSTLATIIFIFESGQELLGSITSKICMKRIITIICIAIVGVQFGLILKYRFITVYRDGEISTLTEKLKIGPAKGIYTSSSMAYKYEKVVADIKNNAPEEGTVLYTKLLPFGYLCTNLSPATPSLWRTQFNSQRLEKFYELNPNKVPKMIYIVDEKYGFTNSDNSIDGELKKYIDSNTTKRLELDSGTMLIIN
ncbi:hypothetical protein [Clostridium sp. LP20]|uniref:hypothetical protein n=1 Tax=Clostridium sp. LP20 TaxID=3418665 RepID=UPI003EE4E5BF